MLGISFHGYRVLSTVDITVGIAVLRTPVQKKGVFSLEVYRVLTIEGTQAKYIKLDISIKHRIQDPGGVARCM